MKSYSIKRMRKECQVIFRVLVGEAVLNLLFSAVFGALRKVLNNGESRTPLIIAGVFLVLAVLLGGLYLVVSDPKWMMRHTAYGKELARLGNVEELIKEIDAEAEKMDYECARFALMRHWMVIYQWSNEAVAGTGAIRSIPVPSRQISRIAWAKDGNDENNGFLVHVYTVSGEEYEIFAWEQADIEALRQWGAIQEKETYEFDCADWHV